LNTLSQVESRFAKLPAPKRVVAIVNPEASKGVGPRLIRILQNRRWGADVEVFLTEEKSLDVQHAAMDYARQHGADRVIVAGGDGLIMQSLTAMLETGDPLPISVIPIGTGNIVAGDLRIPRHFRFALRLAFQEAAVHWWDVGQISDQGYFFALRASVGHDANTLVNVRHQAKSRWGSMAYAIPAVRELMRMQSIQFTLHIDDHPPVKIQGITAFVAVTSRMIGPIPFVLSQEIHADDGVLHAGVIHPRKFFQDLPRIMHHLALEGEHTVSIFPVRKHVMIETDSPQRTQIDGDLLGQTPLGVKVIPRGAPFVVPARHWEGWQRDEDEGDE
jgi:diacylglycerol kinase (ATP)